MFVVGYIDLVATEFLMLLIVNLFAKLYPLSCIFPLSVGVPRCPADPCPTPAVPPFHRPTGPRPAVLGPLVLSPSGDNNGKGKHN